MTWAAAAVLREGAPSDREAAVLGRLALDSGTTPGRRFRALALLRPRRWLHLAVLLEARAATDDDAVRWRLDAEVATWVRLSRTIGRGPDPVLRARIERRLPAVAPHARSEIEFVLRTST